MTSSSYGSCLLRAEQLGDNEIVAEDYHDCGNELFKHYLPSNKEIINKRRSSTASSISDITIATFPPTSDDFAADFNLAPAAFRRRSSEISAAMKVIHEQDFFLEHQESSRRDSGTSFDSFFNRRDSVVLADRRGVAKLNTRQNLNHRCDSFESSSGAGAGALLLQIFGFDLCNNGDDDTFERYYQEYESKRRDSLVIAARRLCGASKTNINYYDETDDEDEIEE